MTQVVIDFFGAPLFVASIDGMDGVQVDDGNGKFVD